MSNLSKFFGKPKEYTIMGEKITLYPLKGKDIDLLMDLGGDNNAEGTKKLLYFYLKNIEPTFTDEEFNELSAEFITGLLKNIIDVNGLSEKR